MAKKKKDDILHRRQKLTMLGALYGPNAQFGSIPTPSGQVTVTAGTAGMAEVTEIAFAEKKKKKDDQGEYEEWVIRTREGKEFALVLDPFGFVLAKDGAVLMTGEGDPWEEFRMVTGISRDELHQVVAESSNRGILGNSQDSDKGIRDMISDLGIT